MNDAPTPASSAPPASPKRPWTILGRLAAAVREQNWFAVVLEIAIVVVGVVIGFQVTAWGQAQSDRAKEQEYLRQLVADLRETEQAVAEADSFLVNGPHLAASSLLHSWGSAERPPRDSVLLWVRDFNRVYGLRPVLGTAEALVATGDLTLLRDDSLRAGITLYLDETRDHLASIAEARELSRQALAGIGGQFDYLEAMPLASESDRRERGRIVAGLSPSGDWASPFPLDVEAFYASQEMYNWVYLAALMHANVGMRREFMREEAAALRERVEAQIEP